MGAHNRRLNMPSRNRKSKTITQNEKRVARNMRENKTKTGWTPIDAATTPHYKPSGKRGKLVRERLTRSLARMQRKGWVQVGKVSCRFLAAAPPVLSR
jgi:hypothetical protein